MINETNKHLFDEKGNPVNTGHSDNGLGWEVYSTIPMALNPFGEVENLEKMRILYNDQTGKVLSQMSEKFNVLPNSQFEEIATLLAEEFGLKVHHFTSHQWGKKVLVVFNRTEEPFSIGEWKIKNNIVLMNAHNGALCFTLGSSNLVARCGNMFASTFEEVKIRHNSNMQQLIETFINAIHQYDEKLEAEFAALAEYENVAITQADIESMKEEIFQVKGKEKIPTQTINKMARFDDSVEEEIGLLGMTVWGLFNAVTHYSTHNAQLKPKANELPLFNDAAKMNEKALIFCNKLMARAKQA